jgi:peptide deformylase
MLLYKDILKEGNATLLKKAVDFTFPLTKEDENIISLTKEYLINSKSEKYSDVMRPAVGLAFPQVGYSKRGFVIDIKNSDSYIVLNPKIISHSTELIYISPSEGCLSIDRYVEGYVMRYKKISIRCYLYDLITKEIKEEVLRLEDYQAIVFQHEYDHLQGIIFTMRIDKKNPFFIPPNSYVIESQKNDNN